MIEYILNAKKDRRPVVHVRVDGMSSEQCNLDQLLHYSVHSTLPAGNFWRWCDRCRFAYRSAGVSPEGVAP